MEINIIVGFINERCGLNSLDSGYVSVTGCCHRINKISLSIERLEFYDNLSHYQFLSALFHGVTE